MVKSVCLFKDPNQTVQSAWAAEGYPPPNECPGYDIKQSNGKAPVMLELCRAPFLCHRFRSTLAQSGSP